MNVTNMTTVDELGLKPIEFLLPNAVLAITEWRSQPPRNDEFNFSMEHLYLVISHVLNYLLPKDGVPEAFITKDLLDRPVDLVNENKLELLEHYRLILFLLGGTFLAAVFIPLLAFLCCCFCKSDSSSGKKPAHKSSSSSESRYVQPHHQAQYSHSSRGSRSARHHHHQSHSRHYNSTQSSARSQKCTKLKVEGQCDCCTRPILSFSLLSLLVLCFIFVVCAFVTNDSIYRGVQNLPKSTNGSLSDVEIYLNNTQYELDVLFKENYDQLGIQIGKTLNKSGDIVNNRLAVISEAVSINNLTQIVLNLQPILADLKRLINHTKELKKLTAQLDFKINRTRQDLAVFFTECSHRICQELEKRFNLYINHFQISTRIVTIQPLNDIVENIEYLLSQDIVTKIQNGKHAMDIISREIQAVVDDILPNIRSRMGHVRKALSDNVDQINRFLSVPIPHIRTVQEEISQGDKLIRRHDEYIYYFGFACASVLLAILLFYFLGLMFGVCNNLPTVYDYKKRSRKSEVFFCFGFLVFFLVFTVLLIASGLLFVSGALTQNTACFYLKNVSNPQAQKILELTQSEFSRTGLSAEHREFFDTLDNLHIDHRKVTDFLERCHRNESLFNVLQLPMDRKVNISYENKEYHFTLNDVILFKEKTKIEGFLSTVAQRLNVHPEKITLLSKEAENLINILKNTSLGTLDLSMLDHIRRNITRVDFEFIAKKLEEESAKLPESEIENAARLNNIAFDLKSSKELVNSIIAELDNLQRNAQKIENKSRFDGVGLRETLDRLLKQAREAQKFFVEKGQREIKEVLKTFINEISEMIAQYIGHAENRVKNEIGRCEPVSRAFNHTVNSLCNDIVQPYTACWFSIYVSLALFLPATILACYLRSLFGRIKRSSVRRESVIIIDSFDDDSIPLAEMDKEPTRRIVPSAPSVSAFDRLSEDGSWSPTPTTSHYSTRPPPYNF